MLQLVSLLSFFNVATDPCIELNPKKDYLYRNMARAYRDSKKYKKAIELHKKSIELNDDYSDNYAFLANTYARSGDMKKSVEMYRKALKYDSEYIFGYLNIFELEVAQNLPFDVELENKFLGEHGDNKEYTIYFEMMKIFQDIANRKEISLDTWSKKYSDTETDWNFLLTDNWIKTITDKKIKEKLLEATKVFKNHKKEN